ncbi:MAG: methylmalonyl Co-A mutase-associated GTPase MeaB [Alphaproteobacteria bacterium]|nr:methylmalonyl Co-A mutase-associated GTPase MeaB [Alphaproteobacteria bacterium]
MTQSPTDGTGSAPAATAPRTGRPSAEEFAQAIAAGNRAMLARAITLIESRRAEHQAQAQEVLQLLMDRTGKAVRLGITGVPGVGKSTTIDQLGINLVEAGHKVAVLAVDPTSKRTGGSILGDKTRMARLAVHPDAYIRPSPTSGTLGGVTRKTRETMALVEAAGFDVIIVETVGVGQSEVAVADMVDFFLVLLLPGGGDDLQGIKKGIIEIADMIAINKADGENVTRAKASAAEYRNALHILAPQSATWSPPVITISGISNLGLEDLWAKVMNHRDLTTASGEFEQRRQRQAVSWMRDMLEARLMAALKGNKDVARELPQIEADVRAGRLLPTLAVERVIALMGIA